MLFGRDKNVRYNVTNSRNNEYRNGNGGTMTHVIDNRRRTVYVSVVYVYVLRLHVRRNANAGPYIARTTTGREFRSFPYVRLVDRERAEIAVGRRISRGSIYSFAGTVPEKLFSFTAPGEFRTKSLIRPAVIFTRESTKCTRPPSRLVRIVKLGRARVYRFVAITNGTFSFAAVPATVPTSPRRSEATRT